MTRIHAVELAQQHGQALRATPVSGAIAAMVFCRSAPVRLKQAVISSAIGSEPDVGWEHQMVDASIGHRSAQGAKVSRRRPISRTVAS